MAKTNDASGNKETVTSKIINSEDTINEQMQNSDDEISPETMEDMFKISSVKEIEIERAIKRVAEIIDEDKKKEEEDEEYDPFYLSGETGD